MDTLVLYRDGADATGLDLSQWVDVDQGGINPGDADVRQAVWAGNASSYGSALAGETVANRNVDVQLLIDGTTPDELAALQRQIKERLDGSSPHLAWTREGATRTAHFRIRYGRLLGSERYDQRREAQTVHARRLLALVCAPYAEANRRRTDDLVVQWATGAGWTTWASGAGISPSNPAFTGPLPSVGGDVEAAMRLLVGVATTAGSGGANLSAYAWGLTRQASYLPFYMSAGAPGPHASGGATFTSGFLYYTEGTKTGPTTVGSFPLAPGGGKFLMFTGTYKGTSNLAIFHTITDHQEGFTQAASYNHAIPNPGRYRVWLAARSMTNFNEFLVRLRDRNGEVTLATIIAGPSGFRWYDMGDHVALSRAQKWEVAVQRATLSGTLYASPALHIAGIALIPKDIGYGHLQTQQLYVNAMGARLGILDGVEADQPLSWGLGNASTFPTNFTQVPLASQFQVNGGEYRGDRPMLPYTPSGGAGTSLHMVVLINTDNLNSPFGPNDALKAAVGWVLQDRYTFSP